MTVIRVGGVYLENDKPQKVKEGSTVNDQMTKEVFEKVMSFLQQMTEDKAERQQRIAILDCLEEKRLELEIQKLQLEIKLLEKEVSDGTQKTTPQ